MTIPLANLNLAAERAIPTPLSNATLLPLLLLSLARQKHTPDASTTIRKEYDYVVVGGGTAGSVVAARLSEVPCVSVLVLEDGPPVPRISDVPGIGLSLWTSDVVAWNARTTPQKYTGWGQVHRQVPWRGGRGLGGSTLINGGVYVRGNKKDYDTWAATGSKGWSYEEVLPYFKKMEDNQDYEYVSNGYHGVGGPVTVMKAHYEPEIKGPVVRAAKELGYHFVDSNGPTQTGFYDMQAHQRQNQRCSTAKAYLVPAENRTNLDILPNASVRKVIINNGRATGVLFDFDGLTYEVGAKREVIMSAGAVHTPKLLMLSGIGPKEELRKFNIPVVADLPVGRNLQDHVGTTVNFVLNSYIQEFTEKLSDEKNIKQYIHDRSGPLASPEGLSVIAFLNNQKNHPGYDFPNYQIYFGEGSLNGRAEVDNMKPEVFQQVFGPYINQSIMYCYVHNLHPKSVGKITLQSTNPSDLPLIDPNYLEHPQDVRDIVEGMKACIRIGNSHHMRQVVSHMFETIFPGCEDYVKDEDRYLECTIRSVLVTFDHYSGTAKMGDPKDPTTVVDPELRVKHVQGLRVVDASIMPIVPSGNTAAPTIMIAEKASDIIKETIACYETNHEVDSDYKYAPTTGNLALPKQNKYDDRQNETPAISAVFKSHFINNPNANLQFQENPASQANLNSGGYGASAAYPNTPRNERISGSPEYPNTSSNERISGSPEYPNTPRNERISGSSGYPNTPSDDRISGSSEYANTQRNEGIGGSSAYNAAQVNDFFRNNNNNLPFLQRNYFLN